MVTDDATAPAADAPQRRVILLGASNLTRGISTVVGACHHFWGTPIDLVTALGHGRSYGARSRVYGRALPSILHSQLWADVERRPRLPTAALVTDIGNDLLYESPVETIARWVAETLDKLAGLDARIVMTRMPVANIDRTPEWKFLLLRRLMFPHGRLSFAAIAERAHQLDERLVALARERGVPLVELRPEWYGMDPIHLKPSAWHEAWHEILRSWNVVEETPAHPQRGFARWLYLQTRRPEQRWFFNIERRCRQPSGRLSDGTVVSVY